MKINYSSNRPLLMHIAHEVDKYVKLMGSNRIWKYRQLLLEAGADPMAKETNAKLDGAATSSICDILDCKRLVKVNTSSI